jgi:hypothetical protein
MAQQRCSWCGDVGHGSPTCPRRGAGVGDYNDATVCVTAKCLPESDVNNKWPKRSGAELFTPDDQPEPFDFGTTFFHD